MIVGNLRHKTKKKTLRRGIHFLISNRIFVPSEQHESNESLVPELIPLIWLSHFVTLGTLISTCVTFIFLNFFFNPTLVRCTHPIPSHKTHSFFLTVLIISLAALSLLILVGLSVSYRMYRKREIIRHHRMDTETGEVPEGERLLPNSPVIT